MSSRRTALHEHLARSSGIVSSSDLQALGYTASGAESLVRRGVVRPVLPGVYRSAAWPPGLRSTLVAVCRYSPDAVVSHTTAGQELRIRAMSDPRIHVLVPHANSPEIPGVVVHRCRQIDPVDVVQCPDGVRLTSPQRTIFDAAALIGVERTESAVEHVLHHGMCTLGTLAGTVERLARGGRPGAQELRAVLQGRAPWAAAVESELELRLVRALREHGFPEPVRQLRIELPNGRFVRADLAYPEWMLILEADHPYWHAGRVAMDRDRGRDRQLTALGWRVVRFTDWDIDTALDRSMRDLRAIVDRVQAG